MENFGGSDMTWRSTYLKKSFRKAFKTVRNQDSLSEMKGFKPIKLKDMVQNEFEKIKSNRLKCL